MCGAPLKKSTVETFTTFCCCQEMMHESKQEETIEIIPKQQSQTNISKDSFAPIKKAISLTGSFIIGMSMIWSTIAAVWGGVLLNSKFSSNVQNYEDCSAKSVFYALGFYSLMSLLLGMCCSLYIASKLYCLLNFNNNFNNEYSLGGKKENGRNALRCIECCCNSLVHNLCCYSNLHYVYSHGTTLFNTCARYLQLIVTLLCVHVGHNNW